MSVVKEWFDKIGANERVEFYDFTITLLDSGRSLLETMGKVARTIEQQADKIVIGKGKLLKQAKLYRFVELGLRDGKPLHTILTGRIPDSEVMMIMAGGQGDLETGLRSAMSDAKGKAAMRKAIIAGLSYPVVLAFLVVGAISWVGTNLMPTLVMLKPVEQWAQSEQNMYWLSHNVGTWFPVAAIVLTLYVVLVNVVNYYVLGDAREKIHGIPPLNIIRKVTAATLLTTLASLLRSGATLRVGLERVQLASKSPYLISYVEQALTNIRLGLSAKGPGRALGSRLFSPDVMVKLEVFGEGKSAQFAGKLEDIAAQARQEAMNTISRVAKITSMLLMFTVAGVIGFTVLMMFSLIGSMGG